MRFQETGRAEAVVIADMSLSFRNENVAICQGEQSGKPAAGVSPR
jgi:hypothetical protein